MQSQDSLANFHIRGPATTKISCDSSRVDSYRYAYRWNTIYTECIQPIVWLYKDMI